MLRWQNPRLTQRTTITTHVTTPKPHYSDSVYKPAKHDFTPNRPVASSSVPRVTAQHVI